MAQKDLLSRLADRGETVIGKITDLPGMHQITEAGTGFRDRIDDLTKRVRGIEALEQRVASLERRLDELIGDGAPKRAAAKGAGPKKTAVDTEKSAAKRATSMRAPEPAEPGA